MNMSTDNILINSTNGMRKRGVNLFKRTAGTIVILHFFEVNRKCKPRIGVEWSNFARHCKILLRFARVPARVEEISILNDDAAVSEIELQGFTVVALCQSIIVQVQRQHAGVCCNASSVFGIQLHTGTVKCALSLS